MSQPDYNCDFPGLVQTDETCFRFSDKSIQENERTLFSIGGENKLIYMVQR